MMKKLFVLLAMAAGLLQAVPSHADFTFAALGDNPYVDYDESRFIDMIEDINRWQPAFVIHVGDIKSGWGPCSDELFQLRRVQFGYFSAPLIYTPGDNEWTDCERAFGARRDPVERLGKLRELFFADDYALGSMGAPKEGRLPLTRQGKAYPENARWEREGVLFITLNVPGGNFAGVPSEALPRYKALDAWVAAAFDEARRRSLRAVVIAMQADPFGAGNAVSKTYDSPMLAIMRETQAFDGEVLLVHGDTHRYRVDHPLANAGGQPLANFTRMEVHGYPVVNWVKVKVETGGPKIRFSFAPGSD